MRHGSRIGRGEVTDKRNECWGKTWLNRYARLHLKISKVELYSCFVEIYTRCHCQIIHQMVSGEILQTEIDISQPLVENTERSLKNKIENKQTYI